MVLWSKKIQYIAMCWKHVHTADIYRAPGGTQHSLIKGSRPKLHSWNSFGGGLSESRKPSSYWASATKKMRLDLDVCSNQKDNVYFFVQENKKKSQKVVTKTQWTCLMLILLPCQPHLHLYLMT